MAKVAVVGLGYVGLPVATAIAEAKSYEVIGYDIDLSKVEQINSGKPPFADQDLEERLGKTSLIATTTAKDISGCDYYLICVPTPVKNDYVPDLEPLRSAAKLVGGQMSRGSSVIVESTVNPGVCEEIVLPILEEISGLKGGVDFELAHCPERINPGDRKWTIYNIPRNIGGLTDKGTESAAQFYRSFIEAEINVVPNLKIAEATKIVENTFRDINIAFVNELAKSFDAMGIDVVETIKGAANKPFGFLAHWPGAGVGGHCIPVDPYYLIKKAAQSGFDHEFLQQARDINNGMPEYMVDLIGKELNRHKLPINGTKIFLYGLSYKPNVGDLRDSPALEIKSMLEELGADLICYDPFVPQLSTTSSVTEGLNSAEILVIATAHEEILDLDLGECLDLKGVVDGRNCLDPDQVTKYGLTYKGIGR